MLIEALVLTAAVTAAPTNHPGYLIPNSGLTHIVNSPAKQITGRIWRGTPIIGGHDTLPAEAGDPGAESYGAVDHGEQVIVRVGELQVAISPWKRWNDESFPHLEAGRQQWLREHGYEGGVRTFVNDLNRGRPMASRRAEASPEQPDLTPKGIIVLPADMPRLKSRMQVDAGSSTEKQALLPRVIKVLEPSARRAEIKIAAKN